MKRLVLFGLALLAASEVEARDRRCGHNRTNRAGECDGYAFFEAFPASGAGTNGVCSTTAPTAARGETLTFTRASSATCTKTATGGLATTGIADGDLVVLGNNVLRVEYNSAGTLGERLEKAGTNLLLRFIAIANAAWSDVGTPTLTGSQASPWTGTYATEAVQIDDNDAAASEGRSQAVTVSAGAAHTMHCLVKAGTRAEASITLDGTAATITGLSSSTWSIIQVTDASSSGVSITAQILVGDAVGDTGTVIFGGCQVETGSVRTSIVPTDGATATRNADPMPYFSPTLGAFATGCIAVSVETLAQPASNSGAMALDEAATFDTMIHFPMPADLYVNGVSRVTSGVASLDLSPSINRLTGKWGSATSITINGSTASAGAFAPSGTLARVYVGGYNGSNPIGVAIVTNAVLDTDPVRCTQ